MAGTKRTGKTAKSGSILPTEQSEKMEALEHALEQLTKQYGKGAIIKMSGEDINRDIPVVSTGCAPLDYALGVGGLPKGRIIEIFGPESSGKTTVALHVIAQAQKAGGIAAFVDAEHALDPVYARNLGVDIDNLYVSQPDTGEQALEIAEALVRSGALDVVVIDSVAALVPKAEIDGEMGDSFVGLQARLMSQALRKLTGVINKSGCMAIFINQLREKVGGMGYGPSETTPGGRALKFYASVRLDVRRIGTLKTGDDAAIGSRTKVKVVKNKVAPPFRIAEFDIIYGEGISQESSLLDLGVEYKLIDKNGAFFSYQGQRLGQGRENARIFLKEHPELRDEIDKKVRDILFAKKGTEKAEKKSNIKGNGKDESAPQAEEEDDLALLDEELEEAEETEET